MWQLQFAKRLIQHLMYVHQAIIAMTLLAIQIVMLGVCVCTYVHVYGPRNCLSLLYVSFRIALSFVCSTLIVCSLSLYLCVHCMNGI